MDFKSKFLIFLVILISLSITQVSANENYTDILNQSDDSLISLEVENKTFGDVQNLINTSASESNINLNGYYISEYNEITIDKSITIDGNNNTTLDARNLSKIFKINANNVVLKNLKFINGYSNENNFGGAIDGTGNNIIISNCIFLNNEISTNPNIAAFGGALYWIGDNITLINNTFENNTAKSQLTDSGYAYSYGAAVCLNGNNLTIIQSVFKNNFVNGNGGLYLSGFDILVEHSIFLNNTATSSGGALYSNGQKISLNNNTFKNNLAKVFNGDYYTGEGGAISIYSSNVSIINSKFDENIACSRAGALNFWGNNITLTNNTFTKNHVALGSYPRGGAIWGYGNNISLNNNSFVDNYAVENGGAVLFDIKESNIINCEFKNNIALNGGAIYLEGSNSTLMNSIFNNNSANIDLIYNNQNGGAIYSSMINLTIDNITFLDNYAMFAGDVIYSNGDHTTIMNSKFNNQRNAVYSTGSFFSIINSEFCENTANYNLKRHNSLYAPLTCTGDYYTVNNVSFISNKVLDSEGGALILSGHHGIINSSIFINNSAKWGGAISVGNAQNLSIINCNFTSSNAIGYEGGAIYIKDSFISFNNCNFINNTASTYGGAISASGSNSTFNNCNFINNHAKDSGSIYSLFASTDIYNCTIINSSAENCGAISMNYGSIIDCRFINNVATNNVGAVSCGGLYGRSYKFIINNSVFIKNIAKNGDSGAIYSDGITFLCYNTSFINNSAKNDGGAVVLYNSNDYISDNIFVNNSFINNTANRGGAIATFVMEKLTINSIFINNTAFISKDIFGYYTVLAEIVSTTFGDIKINLKLTDKFTNTPVSKESLEIMYDGTKNIPTIINKITVKDGAITLSPTLPVDKYSMYVLRQDTRDILFETTFKVVKSSSKISIKKLTTSYDSGKTFNAKITLTNSKTIVNGVKLALKVYTGKKYKTVYAKVKNGVAHFDIDSVTVGKHNVEVTSSDSSISASKVKSTLTIKKAATSVSVSNTNAKLKKSNYFKVKVLNKNTKNPIKKIKINIKVYTGKKYKNYSIKTNSKGIAQLNTKILTKGKHKIIITSGDSNCIISKKSSIVIK